MVNGGIGQSGKNVLLAAVVATKEELDHVIAQHHNSEVTIVRLMDHRVLTLKDAMKTHVLVWAFLAYNSSFSENRIILLSFSFQICASIFFSILVNGAFSAWDDWTPCTAQCGGGDQTRTRRCDSPAPQHGGEDCVGELTECQRCNTDLCPSTCPA